MSNWNQKLKNCLKKHWKILLFVLILLYAYFVIHELLHYFLIRYFGYSAKICWICFPTKVSYLTPINQVLKNHYFISAVAPYILSSLLLLFLSFMFLINRKRIYFYLSIIPFFDTVINILAIPLFYFTKTANDFLNLFKLGIYFETFIIMLTPMVLFLILFLNFKKKIIERACSIFSR